MHDGVSADRAAEAVQLADLLFGHHQATRPRDADTLGDLLSAGHALGRLAVLELAEQRPDRLAARRQIAQHEFAETEIFQVEPLACAADSFDDLVVEHATVADET